MSGSDDPHVFRAMMERVGLLAPRLQIDLMDGDFAPHKNILPEKLWWPEGVQADVHVMYQHPETILDTLLELRPHMIILHAEADTDVVACLQRIKGSGCAAGLALLPETTVESLEELIESVDHILIFGGKLGEPGQADLRQLSKVASIRAIAPRVEIGWDGGANADDIAEISRSGVDVINVGAALQRAEDPAAAYRRLCELVL